ncbi:MAG: HD domain-containing protein [Chloroflexi bacterium]|nr:HD domain-containing protein [Chloroflexota bacterium]
MRFLTSARVQLLLLIALLPLLSLALAPYATIAVLSIPGVVTLAAAWVISHFVAVRPLDALKSAARRLAGGDFTARAALGAVPRELWDLAQTFNLMAQSLELREAERLRSEEGARRQAAVNARLLEETDRRLKDAQALHAIDTAISSGLDLRVALNILLEQVTNRLQVDAAGVLLLNRHAQTLEFASGRGLNTEGRERPSVKVGEGPAGRAALERRVLRVDDLSGAEQEALGSEDFVLYYACPLVVKGEVKGVLEIFHRSALDPSKEWWDFLDALAVQGAVAIDNAFLFSDLDRSNMELALAYNATLEGWARALDLRDKEIEGHSQRVAARTVDLARAVGMGDEELVQVRRGALLHDIGKIAIPDAILLKPGPLTAEEWLVVLRHPIHAYELLYPIAFLRPALDIPYCHHEKWDGSGYPRGLKGEQIPLAARVFAVIDVWDALGSERPYREAWKEEKIREYIRSQAGEHFDPKVVEKYLEMP